MILTITIISTVVIIAATNYLLVRGVKMVRNDKYQCELDEEQANAIAKFNT